MSIPVLMQVADEVRRLSIAGSAVAGGDFRLKKLVPPLEQSGQKAPVFAKVAQSVTQVIDSNEKTGAEAMLELSTLINAILYTQGETGSAGKLEPIETVNFGQQEKQISARMLKAVMQALTETGSGRMEVIQEAFDRGTFRDLRLVTPAVKGLDDPYGDIGTFMAEKVLPMYGSAILPDLRDHFDVKGKGGDVRRLKLMHQLDPQGTRETVKRALDEGSKEVRVAAIECLGADPEDLSFLLEQSKAKAKDVRLAALNALSKVHVAEANKVLCDVIKSLDNVHFIEAIRNCQDPSVVAYLVDQSREQLDKVFADKAADKTVTAKLRSRLLWLLDCMRDRDDAATSAFHLDLFGQREKLRKLKGDPAGSDIENHLVGVMTGGSEKVRRTLVDAHATLGPYELEQAFAVAYKQFPAKEVYDLFSGYLRTEKGKRGGTKSKRDAIAQVISEQLYWLFESPDGNENEARKRFDPRWLDLALELKDESLILALARADHPQAVEYIAKGFAEINKKSSGQSEAIEWLTRIVRMKHPIATDAVVDTITKYANSTHQYMVSYVANLIPTLPKEAVPRLEALLPELPDKVSNPVLEAIIELKSRD